MSVPLGDNELSLQAARSEEGPAKLPSSVRVRVDHTISLQYSLTHSHSHSQVSGLRSHSRKHFTQMD